MDATRVLAATLFAVVIAGCGRAPTDPIPENAGPDQVLRRSTPPTARGPSMQEAPRVLNLRAELSGEALVWNGVLDRDPELFDQGTGPAQSGQWSFELYLDTDHDPTTGDRYRGLGADYSVNKYVLRLGAYPIPILDVLTADRVKTGRATIQLGPGRRLRISVPTSALGGARSADFVLHLLNLPYPWESRWYAGSVGRRSPPPRSGFER